MCVLLPNSVQQQLLRLVVINLFTSVYLNTDPRPCIILFTLSLSFKFKSKTVFIGISTLIQFIFLRSKQDYHCCLKTATPVLTTDHLCQGCIIVVNDCYQNQGGIGL
ncbi:Hypothetical_protein [Hexamita inflata]|uniref:Hypothetical_protein n=1 Tax=Hexamita inflata TaxID=28002 RepID=A0AA86R5G8_9EUKA|nr:Hypothetical protein HINF_LOCUS56878 [Hexamita inflata]